MILTDSLKIREIYVNLMSNAITYTDVGGTISSLEEIEKEEVDVVDDKEIDLTGKHILLVEDNDLNAEIAQTLLEDKGIKVTWAKDGLEAVMMVKENTMNCFDCILMDIQMPRMNGFEACKVIRSLPNNRNKLPIIALMANAFEEDRKACLDAGMSEHVSKPIEIQSLLQTIESVLKK